MRTEVNTFGPNGIIRREDYQLHHFPLKSLTEDVKIQEDIPLDAWPKITLFGDNLVENSMNSEDGCWGAHLAHKVADYYQVDVRGFSGYSSKNALLWARWLFSKEYLKDVHLFVIFLGHNDGFKSVGGWFPSVTIHDYEDNMQEIIRYLLSRGLTRDRIVVITPGWWISSRLYADYMKSNRDLLGFLASPIYKTKEHAATYARSALKVAIQENVSVLDWWEISMSYSTYTDLMSSDGINLSPTGSRYLFDALWEPLVKPKLERIEGKRFDELSMLPQIERILKKNVTITPV